MRASEGSFGARSMIAGLRAGEPARDGSLDPPPRTTKPELPKEARATCMPNSIARTPHEAPLQGGTWLPAKQAPAVGGYG